MGIGTNAVIGSPAMPRQRERHVLDCYEVGREQEVFKWSSESDVYWLSQKCNEEVAHLRVETYDRLLSST